MAQKTIFLIFLTNCALLDLAYGLIGDKVRNAKTREFPFAVSIAGRPTINVTDPKYVANLHICTGAVVSRKNVLTVAHCLSDKHTYQVEIIAGATNLKNGEKYFPESWITFDQWNRHQPTRYPQNDIAVITLTGEGFTNRAVVPIPIAADHLNDPDVRIMGWGESASGKLTTTLKTALLKVVTNDECGHQGTMLKGTKFTVPPNYFCSKAKPWVLSTPGDGGAPVVNNIHQLAAINVGPCPKVEDYPENMLHELLMNCHLNLYYYKGFIMHNIIP